MECARTVASAKMKAAKQWPGLLLRVGLPVKYEERPIVIARFAGGDDECVRLMTVEAFREVVAKAESGEESAQGERWRRIMRDLSPPSPTALSAYSEVDVPRLERGARHSLEDRDDNTGDTDNLLGADDTKIIMSSSSNNNNRCLLLL